VANDLEAEGDVTWAATCGLTEELGRFIAQLAAATSSLLLGVFIVVNASLLGSVNTTMLGNVIQREMLINNDYPTGAAISFILMAAILIGVFVYARLLGTEELTG